MSSLTKGLALGIIAGLLIGVGLGYALIPKADTSRLEQRIDELNEQVLTLRAQVDDLLNRTNTLQLSLNEPPEPMGPIGPGFDLFMLIEEMPGESTDARHKGWIEVLSFRHEVSQPTPPSPIDGIPEHQDFTIYKHIDKSSPKLFLYVNTGESIPEARLELSRNGTTVMVYILKDVLVTSLRLRHIEEVTLGSFEPIEEVSFAYSQILLEYTPVDEAGQPETPVTAGWNLVENKRA